MQLEEYSELAPHEAETRTGKGHELDFFSVFFQLLPRCGTSLQVVLLKRLNGASLLSAWPCLTARSSK
jgi:hypothetical protein